MKRILNYLRKFSVLNVIYDNVTFIRTPESLEIQGHLVNLTV